MNTMSKTEYSASIVKARELGYTFEKIHNTGGAYKVYNTDKEFICFDYELSKYFLDRGICF
jgi:hypothetical protein